MNSRLEEYSHRKMGEFIDLNLGVLGCCEDFYIPVDDVRLNSHEYVVKGKASVNTRKEGQKPTFAASVQASLAVHAK